MFKAILRLNIVTLIFLFATGVQANTEMSQTSREALKMTSAALKEDLSGSPQSARVLYDYLIADGHFDIISLPSAVNYARLGQFPRAQKEFALLMGHENIQVANYAAMWDLWLTARSWKGSKTKLQAALKEKVSQRDWRMPSEKIIAAVYSGEREPGTVYTAIDQLAFSSESEKSDAITQSLFFTAGYLTYIQKKPSAALRLYREHASELNNESLEKPFIDDEVRRFSANK